MPNFKLQKCDETDLKYLPNTTQSIWSKTSLRLPAASEHTFMPRLLRAMIVSLSVIACQVNAHCFVTGCQLPSLTKWLCWQC